MMKYALILLAVCSMAMAQEEPLFFGESDVIGHRFVLDKLNGKKFESPREVFIEFPERGKIAGRICNAFNGPCDIERYVLTANVASTRMLCPDHVLRDFENKFFQFMRHGIGFVRYGDTLEFRRDDTVAEFRLDGRAGDKSAPVRPTPAVRPAPAEQPAAVAPTPAPAPSANAAGKGTVSETDLEGRKFVLALADGEPFTIKMGQQPFIQFAKGMKANGRACNTFMGPASIEGGKLFMRNAAMTMMMCVDPALSGYERDFHKLLQSGADIVLKDHELTLSGNGKTYVYREEK